jgi:integrase/recombinase XerD
MTYILNDRVSLLRPPEGPLARYISSFATWAAAQRYALPSVRQRARMAAGFSRWLAERSIRLRSVSSSHCARYLRHRGRQRYIWDGDAAALRHLLYFLRNQGVIPAEKIRRRRLIPVEQCAQAFGRYLGDERLLAKVTIRTYLPFIRDFLGGHFGTGPVRLSRLSPRDVAQFVQRRAQRLHLGRAKILVSALRSFLRYVRYRGDIWSDLAAAVPSVANWSMASIPRGIAPDQAGQLLAQINRRTAVGRRDYAILLLLVRLGLRCGEVAFLELEDIDWKDGSLSVRGKSGRPVKLPLPTDVGEAIVEYLRFGRPRGGSRHVFLRARAPVRGFLDPCAVRTIISRALKRAGIDAPTMGAHQFRHGLAADRTLRVSN